MDKKCNSDNCDKCYKCNMYYSFHSSHYESYYNRDVVNITCCHGEAGTYDAKTGQRLSTL